MRPRYLALLCAALVCAVACTAWAQAGGPAGPGNLALSVAARPNIASATNPSDVPGDFVAEVPLPLDGVAYGGGGPSYKHWDAGATPTGGLGATYVMIAINPVDRDASEQASTAAQSFSGYDEDRYLKMVDVGGGDYEAEGGWRTASSPLHDEQWGCSGGTMAPSGALGAVWTAPWSGGLYDHSATVDDPPDSETIATGDAGTRDDAQVTFHLPQDGQAWAVEAVGNTVRTDGNLSSTTLAYNDYPADRYRIYTTTPNDVFPTAGNWGYLKRVEVLATMIPWTSTTRHYPTLGWHQEMRGTVRCEAAVLDSYGDWTSDGPFGAFTDVIPYDDITRRIQMIDGPGTQMTSDASPQDDQDHWLRWTDTDLSSPFQFRNWVTCGGKRCCVRFAWARDLWLTDTSQTSTWTAVANN